MIMVRGDGTIPAMKTLDKLQKLARIGKIISRIFLFASIFMVTASIIVLMAFILSGEMSNDVRNFTIGGLLGDSSRLASLDAIIYVIALTVYFIGHTYLWNSAYRYFALEVGSGTPFRNENYVNLRSLGIATIVFPFFFELLTIILLTFSTEHVFNGSVIMEYDPSSMLSLGAMILLASVICRYGAELEAKRNT